MSARGRSGPKNICFWSAARFSYGRNQTVGGNGVSFCHFFFRCRFAPPCVQKFPGLIVLNFQGHFPPSRVGAQGVTLLGTRGLLKANSFFPPCGNGQGAALGGPREGLPETRLAKTRLEF